MTSVLFYYNTFLVNQLEQSLGQKCQANPVARPRKNREMDHEMDEEREIEGLEEESETDDPVYEVEAEDEETETDREEIQESSG